jgi:hypothetical protein
VFDEIKTGIATVEAEIKSGAQDKPQRARSSCQQGEERSNDRPQNAVTCPGTSTCTGSKDYLRSECEIASLTTRHSNAFVEFSDRAANTSATVPTDE